MMTHIVAEWIPNAPKDIRNVFDSVLLPTLSTVQMANRIRNLATHGYFQDCPWQVRIQLLNPGQVDWELVRRIYKAN